MKSAGIVRKVDNLGRIVVPRETRRIINIQEKDTVEIFVEGENIILQKCKEYSACPITEGEKQILEETEKRIEII